MIRHLAVLVFLLGSISAVSGKILQSVILLLGSTFVLALYQVSYCSQ